MKQQQPTWSCSSAPAQIFQGRHLGRRVSWGRKDGGQTKSSKRNVVRRQVVSHLSLVLTLDAGAAAWTRAPSRTCRRSGRRWRRPGGGGHGHNFHHQHNFESHSPTWIQLESHKDLTLKLQRWTCTCKSEMKRR